MATKSLIAATTSAMNEEQWVGLFPDGRRSVSVAFVQPDFAVTFKSMKNSKHLALQQGCRMSVRLVSAQQGRKYGYSRYCELFTEFVATHDVLATLYRDPGRALLVDWTGDTLPVRRSASGV
ncbi:hypothetical protein [Cryobacterium sp. Hb1]|uniref:hypothetical protein n=1 Tax=Cryobacterium sp. Hb1 TaxID=1259147 RepID=UPI00141BC75D|nr:hypothetical protein [Cryobacterium sp. Hb1]